METIFTTLCLLLNRIGRLLHWDYQTASVNICIHLWPWLCIAMSVVMLVCAIVNGCGLWIVACIIYALLCASAYYAVVRHYYPNTVSRIFELCHADLQVLAKQWHTTYAVVNLLIYVVLFVMIMTFDSTLILLMFR